MKTKVIIYARVSTQIQDYTRQLEELREYAQKMNYEVVKEFQEKYLRKNTLLRFRCFHTPYKDGRGRKIQQKNGVCLYFPPAVIPYSCRSRWSGNGRIL